MLLTAKDDIETRSRGMLLGVSEYLTKPVNKLELFARLQAQLHSRELERRMDATAATVADAGEEVARRLRGAGVGCRHRGSEQRHLDN